MLAYRYYDKIIQKDFDLKLISPSDYTVMITGIPYDEDED